MLSDKPLKFALVSVKVGWFRQRTEWGGSPPQTAFSNCRKTALLHLLLAEGPPYPYTSFHTREKCQLAGFPPVRKR